MATVVVTFFLITRILFCKMDAEEGRERISSSSRRGQRWSLMSQRLEHLVKLLMMPVMSHGQSFDRDDAALLEAYLTEAGIRLLEEGGAMPNFAEIGMLVQSYACNYSRKVDHLHHLGISLRSTLYGFDCEESSNPEAEAEPSPRRRRGTSDSGEFAPIVLTPAPQSARRAPLPAGPPPALPRQYSELAAREVREDRALHAYLDGESIGSLDDFHVSRRTQRGYLVDELEADDEEEEEEEEEPAQPLSLLQLQADIERNAAGSPPPAPPFTPLPASPRSPSPSPPPAPRTPPPDLAPVATSTPLATPLPVRRRNHSIAPVELVITLETDVELEPLEREFEVPESWVRRVVHARRAALLQTRRTARRRARRAAPGFRGFDTSWMDIGGFRGWEREEISEARATARRLSAALMDSDDDGFFERTSSLSPRQSEPPLAAVTGTPALSWQEEVVRRAALAPPLDVHALARDVRRALVQLPEPVSWPALTQCVRRSQPQPSHVLLDVLHKATRGELEVLPGAPLSVGEFSMRLLDAGGEASPPLPAGEEGGPPPPDP